MKAKTRKVVTGVCALVLTAAVSIAGTIAYLTKTTEYRANNFTFASTAVNAMLTEPYWDSVIDYYYEKQPDGSYVIHPIYDYIDKHTDNQTVEDDETVYGYVDGDRSKPIKYTPAELVSKKTSGFDGNESYLNDLFSNTEYWDSTESKWKDGKDPWDLYQPPKEYPNEDNSVYNDRYDANKLNTDGDPAQDKLGRLSAQLMVPGRVANKNPIVTNIGTTDEWVAVKISFVYSETAGLDENDKPKAGKVLSDADYALVQKIIRIDWNENVIGGSNNNGSLKDPLSLGENGTDEKKWLTLGYSTAQGNTKTTLEGADKENPLDVYLNSANYLFEEQQTVFYYTTYLQGRTRTSLSVLDKTEPIFTTVSVDKNASTEDIKALEEMGGFAIYIEGYAIQKEAFTDGEEWASDICEPDLTKRTASFGSDKLTFISGGTLYDGRSNEYIDGDENGKTVDQPGIKASPDGPGEKVEVVDETKAD